MTASRLMQLAARGEMGRRAFIQLSTAAGLSTVAAHNLFREARASEPRRGGHFRLGLAHGATTDTLDPAVGNHALAGLLCFARGSTLTEVGFGAKLQSELAESWESSNGASTWRFTLRKGVTFHNGKSLTSDDVVASINHHRRPDSKSAVKAIVDSVSDVRADGSNVVVVELSGGNADFPFLMSDYHLIICPAASDGIDWQSGIGSGAYRIKSFEPGVRTELERNPNYFKNDRGHFETVEILTIADTAARQNALTTDSVDAIDRVDLRTVELLKSNSRIRVIEVEGTGHYTFPMNTTVAPFDDNNVRMALKLAIDREQILKTVLGGFGKIGNDHPISPTNRYFASEIEQRTYDPEKAKWHLRQAGLETLKVDFAISDAAFAGAEGAALIYQANAEKAGISINVERVPKDGYWDNVWMKRPWSAGYWNGRPTEDWMLTTVYAKGASWNETFWDNERFNKILVEARSELDEARRRELYVEMQRLIRDDGGALVPLFNNYVGACSDKVQHGDISGHSDLDGFRMIERWWLT